MHKDDWATTKLIREATGATEREWDFIRRGQALLRRARRVSRSVQERVRQLLTQSNQARAVGSRLLLGNVDDAPG